jgi:SulP family sulfate permease
LAFPFAVQLALLCYLDTLLTSRIVDTMSGETTRQDAELHAQGIANTAVAFVGGIPGAQATIRSVLILKEGATMRLAGVSVGIFVLVELIAFQDLIGLIPHAVFTGVLVKVGYDVFDWGPVRRYALQVWDALRDDPDVPRGPRVSHTDAVFIAGTAAATLAWNLNVAVIGGTLAFHAVKAMRASAGEKIPESGSAMSDEE